MGYFHFKENFAHLWRVTLFWPRDTTFLVRMRHLLHACCILFVLFCICVFRFDSICACIWWLWFAFIWFWYLLSVFYWLWLFFFRFRFPFCSHALVHSFNHFFSSHLSSLQPLFPRTTCFYLIRISVVLFVFAIFSFFAFNLLSCCCSWYVLFLLSFSSFSNLTHYHVWCVFVWSF